MWPPAPAFPQPDDHVDARYQYYEELLPSVERAQELIRTLPSQRLFDRDYLEHELIPALGLNNEQLHEQPQALAPHFGKGLHLWQYPNQLSGYLVWMARHASHRGSSARAPTATSPLPGAANLYTSDAGRTNPGVGVCFQGLCELAVSLDVYYISMYIYTCVYVCILIVTS